jgi:hypothetical protein
MCHCVFFRAAMEHFDVPSLKWPEKGQVKGVKGVKGVGLGPAFGPGHQNLGARLRGAGAIPCVVEGDEGPFRLKERSAGRAHQHLEGQEQMLGITLGLGGLKRVG